jgi:hypothetical protein
MLSYKEEDKHKKHFNKSFNENFQTTLLIVNDALILITALLAIAPQAVTDNSEPAWEVPGW